MWSLKIAYYRAFQKIMKIAMFFMDWSEPELLTGPGAILKLPEVIKQRGISKVMIVTDKGLMSLNLLDGLFGKLKEEGISYVVYDGVQPNPSIENIEEAREMFVANGCEAMIAFGGGSPMDCAKAACARVVRPNKTIPQMRGVMKVMRKLPPFFAVPTTAGTGSETTLAAVVSNTQTHEKYAINDPVLRPKFAVLDPELTTGLPKKITSTTGMDALTHAVEAYIGLSNVRSTREYAEKATALIFKYLEVAYNDGQNIEARGQMLLASYYAGMAFTRAYVGYVHAIAHNLGGHYGIPHGLANAVILPVILEEFGSAIYPSLAKLADCAGIAGQTEEEKAKNFIAEIYAMNERMEIPTGFTQIKDEDIPTIVERAMKEAHPLYPVPVIFDKERLTAIVKKLQIEE
ncbi:MAG: iron-containing alcohol dehydrogenase [Clostridiaceae bacterium]|nr:iron-containing alcohol dehydrogenase [Clostridiaceae bacterium]